MGALSSGSAAGLLQFLDEQQHSVIDSVMSQLQLQGVMEAGMGLYFTSSAAPISLQVDVTALADKDAGLAVEVMCNTGQLEAQAAALINQQLASMQPVPDPEDEVPEAPTVRVSLQMQQVPLPLSTVPKVVQQVVASSSSPSSSNSLSNSLSNSSSVCVSLLAVVTGLTPPADVCFSQRFHCPSCGQLADALTTQHSLPCCNIPKTDWLKEDITGRVMVQAQQLWVSELSCATGRSTYGCSAPALRVQLPELLVGSCSLGQVVHITGHASSHLGTAAGGAGCCIQVKANNLQVVVPHMTWALPPAAAAPLQQPLHQLWDLTTAGLGYNTLVDPHLAVAMLLSAAAAAGGSSDTSTASRQSEQVNLLVLHEAFSPSTPRLLREAAALLSPQSVKIPVQLAENVAPITGGGPDQDKAVFASILQLANSGIAAADLALMSNKVRTQLLQALQQRQTPTPKDMPAGLLLPPLTATCWAAASWQEVCPGLTGHDGGARTAGRRGAAAAAGDKNYNGFDLCIGDGTVHEDDIWGCLDIQAASPAEQAQLQQSQQEAATRLRHLMGAAAGCAKPVLSETGQAFIGQYFLMVRQSIDGSSHVSKPHLLASVVATATAAARLRQGSTVLECPDATLAVVLMEHTLANKLGDAYHSLLELPCDLQPVNDRTLDEQVLLLHGVISRAFRQSGFSGYGGLEADGHCAGDCSQDSGDSGCNGSVCADGGGLDDPEE